VGGDQAAARASADPLDRRRSPRLQAVTSVRVAWHNQEGSYARVQAETEDVSAHGALLRMDRELPPRSVVVLNHGPASNWTMARVMRSGPARPDGWTPVAVELAVPSESFWAALGWAAMASSSRSQAS
jgi:hypothetical protein